jgi:hypothetical protein
MSQNIFQIDPIFFLPIDLEENSTISKESKESYDTKLLSENYINKIDIEEDITNEYSFSGKELDQSLNINKNNNKIGKKDKPKEFIIYSVYLNEPNSNIKSMANSSKIYISEILKSNWKLKSRRLITKLKKRLIKQYKNLYLNNNNNINNTNIINNNYDNINIINFNNKNNNKFICDYNFMGNKIIHNNNNQFVKQYNNNYEIVKNLSRNNNWEGLKLFQQ